MTTDRILAVLLRKLASGGTLPTYTTATITTRPEVKGFDVTLDDETYFVGEAELYLAPASIACPGAPEVVQGTNVTRDVDAR